MSMTHALAARTTPPPPPARLARCEDDDDRDGDGDLDEPGDDAPIPAPDPAAIAARNARVEENIRLVHHIARTQFAGRGLGHGDLCGYGMIGLVRAAERFEEERGYQFSTFAIHEIRFQMWKGLALARSIRLPSHALKFLDLFHRVASAMPAADPDDEAVMDAMGVPARAKVRDSRRDMLRTFRAGVTSLLDETDEAETKLYIPATWDGPTPTEVEEGARDAAREVKQAADRVEAMLGVLPPRSRSLFALRYGLGGGEPLTYAAIAQRLGITRQRVRQVHDAEMSRLRRQFCVGAAAPRPGG